MTTETIDTTLAQRGSKYGEFRLHAAITQVLKSAMRGTLFEDLQNPASVKDLQDSQKLLKEKWGTLRPDVRECLEMLQHKIGRALNGDPEYFDNFRDAQGYSKLVEDRINNEASEAAAPKPAAPAEPGTVWALEQPR